jgi:two-component system LytT family response regulator
MRNPDNILRVLIADDEAPARRKLRRILESLPNIAIYAEADDGPSTLACLAENAVDVVFLDIQMPGVSGIELAAQLPEPRPWIVFVTACQAHAIDAFELNAVDYLLKPYDEERLRLAVDRVQARYGRGESQGGIDKTAKQLGALQRLLVRTGDGMRIVETDSIRHIKAEGNYVMLSTRDARLLHREPMAQLLERLDPSVFVRVHRGFAVNIRHVKKLVPLMKGDGSLELADGRRLPYSRVYRANLLAQLGQ